MLESCPSHEKRKNFTLFSKCLVRERILTIIRVLPGGHIDKGEYLEEGVLRELREETGIAVFPNTDFDDERKKYIFKGKQCSLIPFYLHESVAKSTSPSISSFPRYYEPNYFTF
jgi:8-oxo-dGTP pyrophosphatase MutT (NUDIX family)